MIVDYSLGGKWAATPDVAKTRQRKVKNNALRLRLI